MATSKKRIVFYGDQEMYSKLERAAENLNMSVSKLINETMKSGIDPILKTSELVKLAVSDPEKAQIELTKIANDSQLDLLQTLKAFRD